jgi:folate-binding protein YgfZ
MPESPDATYDAIRHGVAWRVVATDGVVVSGPGALDWLQGQVSQDISGFRSADPSAPESFETLILSPQGKIESFCRICSIGPDRYLLDIRAGFGEALLERLRRFKLRVKADLELVHDLSVLEMRGPGTPLVQEVTALDGATALATLAVSWPGCSGTDVLFVGPSHAIDPSSVGLLSSAAGDDTAFEAARIEAGMPQLGVELTERTIPQEAGDLVARTVSFTKGCYTGQELVARIDARGSNTPRRLHGVVIDGAAGGDGEAGDEVRLDGNKIGELTSVAWSPGFGSHVALAYVKRGIKAPISVEVVGSGQRRPGTIRSLPLFEG